MPFALGADKAFTYTYELMKIIPGFAEGWDDARKLLPYMQRTRPDPFVTIVAPVGTEAFGHSGADWGASYFAGVMETMYRAGLPWRWFYDHRLVAAADQLTGPLIVPDAHCLTAEQIKAIEGVARRGEGVLWIGNTPQVPPSAVEGEYELSTGPEQAELLAGLTHPIILASRAVAPPWDGQTIGRVGEQPGLLVMAHAQHRQAWLAGWPKYNYARHGVHGVVQTPTGGIELLRRLLMWVSRREPLVRFESLPVNDYARIRPWDQRALHNAELLPMAGDEGVLAIIFPYTPVAFTASLLFTLPPRRKFAHACDLWSGKDLTNELQPAKPGCFRLPIRFPGERELMAIWAEYDSLLY